MSPGYDTSEQMRTEKENEKGRAARYPTRKSTRRAMELRSPWARMSTAAAQRQASDMGTSGGGHSTISTCPQSPHWKS